MSDTYARYETDGHIATITFSHDERRNRLDYSFTETILRHLQEAANNFRVRAVVLRAEGDSFCEGTDPEYLSKLQQYTLEENVTDTGFLGQLYHSIHRFKKIVIAEVNGKAFNEGLGLLSACDFVFASDKAQFAMTDVRYANIPAVAMYFLIRKLGEQACREFMLKGQVFDAKAAHQLGLVYQLTTEDRLHTETLAFAQELAKESAPGVMEYYKKMLADLPGMPYQDALAFAAKINAHARSTNEYRQGLEAQLNDETVKW